MAEEVYVGIDEARRSWWWRCGLQGERMTLANDRAGIKRLVARFE